MAQRSQQGSDSVHHPQPYYLEDVDGLAESFDSLRYKSPKAEKTLLGRWLRSGQHAARKHREKVAEIVASLFKDTQDGK